MLLVALLLVLAGTVSAEGKNSDLYNNNNYINGNTCLCPTVYFYPNDSIIAICNVTTLTCVTNTGWLRWSTPIVKDHKTFISSSGLHVVGELGEHITVQLTSKDEVVQY